MEIPPQVLAIVVVLAQGAVLALQLRDRSQREAATGVRPQPLRWTSTMIALEAVAVIALVGIVVTFAL